MSQSGVAVHARRLRQTWRQLPERTRFVAAVAAAAVGFLVSAFSPSNFKVAATEAMVLVLSALALRALALVLLSAIVVAGVALAVAFLGDRAQLSLSGALLLLAVAVVNVVHAVRRDRLGLGRTSAESVIGQVRRRLRVQGEVPSLPDGWHVDVQQLAADGAAIAGDFVSSRVHHVDGSAVLDIALVDVSGKGIEAGSRALLLSGAVGGLLGSVPPEEFLSEVNSYLNRQRWVSGFATCVYVRVDLATGAFTALTAGHPPPLTRSADGTWSVAESRGTLLGVVPSLRGVAATGRIGEGDLLVLITDGVIEDRIATLEEGNERLRTSADRYLAARRAASRRAGGQGVRTDAAYGLAQRLVETVPTRNDDDRAVAVIWRAEGADAPSAGRAGADAEPRSRPAAARPEALA